MVSAARPPGVPPSNDPSPMQQQAPLLQSSGQIPLPKPQFDPTADTVTRGDSEIKAPPTKTDIAFAVGRICLRSAAIGAIGVGAVVAAPYLIGYAIGWIGYGMSNDQPFVLSLRDLGSQAAQQVPVSLEKLTDDFMMVIGAVVSRKSQQAFEETELEEVDEKPAATQPKETTVDTMAAELDSKSAPTDEELTQLHSKIVEEYKKTGHEENPNWQTLHDFLAGRKAQDLMFLPNFPGRSE